MQTEDAIVSLSFDRFPARKGAAVHISAFAKALGAAFNNVHLVTVAPIPAADLLTDAIWLAPGVKHHPLSADGATLFERVLHFREQIGHWWWHHWGLRGARPRVIHFRSIFEGYQLAREKTRFCEQLVFEVNGLPSIELKYHYPAIADDRELMRKLVEQERVCLAAADRIITVSQVNARHLESRGVDRHRMTVIPNGVHLDEFEYSPPRNWADENGTPREIRMLYAGTLSPWQGVTQAIEALSLYARDFPARLTLAGPARPKERRAVEELAWKLGVSDRLELAGPVEARRLAELHHSADVILAPLTRNDRNCDQGCCPLKVLEALASGTPLIASDLEVVRELCQNDVHALLVKAGSSKSIKDAMLRLLHERGLAQRLSETARTHVAEHFRWERSCAQLVQVYRDLQRTSECCES